MAPAASNSAHADSPADHMSGHRGRMRAKLLDKGSEALSELELLEMLLYAGNGRGDTKLRLERQRSACRSFLLFDFSTASSLQAWSPTWRVLVAPFLAFSVSDRATRAQW